MRKINWLFVTIILLGCTQSNIGQCYWVKGPESTASGVTIPPVLSAQQQHNLNVLCRVWGFIKYFHPTLAKGNVDADKGLFAVMPEVLNATDNNAVDSVLFNWLAALGEVPERSVSTITKNIFREANMRWLEADSLLGVRLRQQLNYILRNRHQGNGHYVSGMPGVRNPDFSHEFRYNGIRGEDGGMRMLGLFRFWNAIEYFFPSKYLTADNWDSVLQKFIPEFAAATTDSAYRFTVRKLVATIHDTHSSGIGMDLATMKYLGKYILPVAINDLEGNMVVWYHYSDSLQKAISLRPGDKILAINRRKVADMMDSVGQYVPASNRTALRMLTMSSFLARSQNADNLLTIERDGKTFDMPVTYANNMRSRVNWFSVSQYPMFRMLDDDIGYINLEKIRTDSLKEIFKTFSGTKGLIIDIRNYPRAFMPFAMGKFLKPKPSAFVKITYPDYTFPGRFLEKPEFTNGQRNADYYKGKIVILVNNESVSQSEYTAMALRSAPNAIIMGSQTLGADGNISGVRFPGGMGTNFSGLGIYYPDGRVTQGIGIVPDIEVIPTIRGIREGKDEVLEKAIEYIRTKQ